MKTIILPGLGADSTMFPRSGYMSLSEVSFVDWPCYKGEQTIVEVARSVIANYDVTGNDLIGGASLGGMVAVEIAKILKLKRVFLIGSATTPNTVNSVLRKLSSFADITPIHLLQVVAGKINSRGRIDLFTMFQGADKIFIKAMCKAIFEWEGIADCTSEIFHIHGADDKVIFPPENEGLILENAGHLISMTHSEQVCDFIKENVC